MKTEVLRAKHLGEWNNLCGRDKGGYMPHKRQYTGKGTWKLHFSACHERACRMDENGTTTLEGAGRGRTIPAKKHHPAG